MSSKSIALIVFAVCAYIYVGVVVAFLFEDFPDIIIHLAGLVAIAALYSFFLAREGEAPYSHWRAVKLVAVTFASVALAVLLAMVTVVVADTSLRREVLAPITNCERVQSAITTMPVNQTIETPGVRITLQNVTYNVPQRSERPQPYDYQCQKATLVEVEIERTNDPGYTGNGLNLYDFKLRTAGDNSVSAETSPDEYVYYGDRKKIDLLEHSSFKEEDKTATVRGWMIFPINETSANNGSAFVYAPELSKVEVSAPLPNPAPKN